MKYSVAFINPFSSTKYIVDTLKKYNINSIAIFTDYYFQKIVPVFDPNTEGFRDVMHFKTEDLKEELIQKLRKLNTLTVIYGYESDMELCDELAGILSPGKNNSINTAHFRENKHETVNALHQANLNYPRELLFNLSTVSTDFEKLKDFTYPAIIKPIVCSGAMNGCKYIHSYHELKQYLQQNQSKIHDQFILQEYLTDIDSTDRIEISYSVDTISDQGKHYIVSVQRWHKHKTKGNPVHYYSEQLLPKDPYFKKFVQYTPKILNAVGLHNGFCHPEFYLTNNGPVLIDLNPRLGGAKGFLHQMMYECLGTCPVHRLGELLTQQPFATPHKETVTYGYCIYYRTSDQTTLDQIKKLESHHSHANYKGNLYLILITHSDQQQCKSDLEFILESNEQGN